MGDDQNEGGGRFFTKPLAILLALMMLVVIILLLPWFKNLLQSGSEQRIRIAVEAAGRVCLLDASDKELNDFQSSVISKIDALSAKGKLQRETARKSVDLSINENLLIEERKRVRDCMRENVPVFLAEQGLVEKREPPSSPIPTDTLPAPAISTSSTDSSPAKADAVAWKSPPYPKVLAPPVNCPCLQRSLLPPPYPTPYPKGSIAQLLNQCSGEVRFLFDKAVPRQSAPMIVDNLRAVTVLQPNDVRTFDVGGAVNFNYFVESCVK